MRSNGLAFAAFASISCGSPPRTSAPHPLPSANAQADASPKRAPSAAIAKYRAANATLFVYADLEGFFSSKLGAGLASTLAKIAGPETAKCLDSIAAAGKEVLVSSGKDGLVGALRFDPAKMTDPKACPVMAPYPGIALFGDPKAVLQRDESAIVPLEALALDRSEYVRGVYDDKPITARISVATSDASFAFHAEADLPEANARSLAADYERQRAMLPSAMKDATSDERETIGRLMRFTKFTQHGSHISFAIDLQEPPLEQARDIGTMAALAISGVRKYLIASKEAEVRSTLPVIARSIATDWERESLPPLPRAKKKLRSFPPVPTAVPRGTKYTSTPADWAPWSPLRFEIDEPQYYQYEIRAAKDGLSADVIAHGDLNGDAKPSTFVIRVTVKPDHTLDMSPIAETDPDE